MSIKVFAPLRGWYMLICGLMWNGEVFAPLRGWYNPFNDEILEAACFRPLTGMVLKDTQKGNYYV